MESHERISIFKSFSGKNVLLTGVSDFVGKCVLEKLLRLYLVNHGREYGFRNQSSTISRNNLGKRKLSPSVSSVSQSRGRNEDFSEKFDSVQKHVTSKVEGFDFKKLYLLRNSGSLKVSTHRELFNSPVFDNIKAELSQEQWNQFLKDKVVVLESTIEDSFSFATEGIDWENVSMRVSRNDDQILKNNIHLVIHCECYHALIYSNLCLKQSDPELTSLTESFRVNVLGTMMLLNYCKNMESVESFCYLSSSFVNCDQKDGSYTREEIYPLKLPKHQTLESFAEDVCSAKFPVLGDKKRKRMNLSGLLRQLRFPNAYTLSKRVSEHLIQKYRGSMSVAIVRPSIIGAAEREPMRGWIDPQQVSSQSFSSAGIFLRIGLGLIRVIPGNPENHADQIPVDYVVNGLLLASTSVAGKGKLTVFHVGSSSGRNSCTWAETIRGVLTYWQAHPLKVNGSPTPPAEFQMVPKKVWFHATSFLNKNSWFNQSLGSLTRGISNSISTFSKIPQHDVGRLVQEMQLQATQINQTNRLGGANSLSLSFLNDTSLHYFTLNEWCFETHNLFDVFERLSKDEQSIFPMDVEDIDWLAYFQYFCYGLVKYCLKEDVDPPIFSDLLTREGDHSIIPLSAAGGIMPRIKANDLSFVYYANSVFNSTKSKTQFMTSVMHSKHVQRAIRNEMTSMSCSRSQAEARALAIMDKMFADPQMKYVRTFSYILRKVWRVMYNAIFIDTDEMAAIRRVVADPESGSLILLPTHRSYIDFLIISFVCFAYDLPIPHIAAGEDFLGMLGVRTLFRHSGAFFLRRSFKDDDLYKAIFQEYVQQLLSDGAPLEFFVEGTRSRGGKTMQPKLGLLSIICDAYFSRRVDNLTIIPINISYEKVLEREAYSYELLGEQKTPETLTNLLKNVYSILSKSYGSIAVSFSQPIPLSKYVLSVEPHFENSELRVEKKPFNPHENASHRKFLVQQLAATIARKLDETAVIMPTALISTITLQNRGGITRENLQERMIWLRQEITARQGRVYWSPNELSSSVVDRCLSLMKNELEESEGTVRPRVKQLDFMDYTKHIQLHCYRNQLIHIFAKEAMVACALSACLKSRKYERSSRDSENVSVSSSSSVMDGSVDISNLIQECKFLFHLINIEFILNTDNGEMDFNSTIDFMLERGILSWVSDEAFPQMEDGNLIQGSLSSSSGSISEISSHSKVHKNSIPPKDPIPQPRSFSEETVDSKMSNSQIPLTNQELHRSFVGRENISSSLTPPDNKSVCSDDMSIPFHEGRIQIGDKEAFYFLQTLIWPFIDTYWVSVQAIQSLSRNVDESGNSIGFDQGSLLERIQWLAEKCFFNGQIQFYESCCLDIIKNAVSVLIRSKVLEKRLVKVFNNEEAAEKKKSKEELFLSNAYSNPEILNAFSSHISKFRKIGRSSASQSFLVSKI